MLYRCNGTECHIRDEDKINFDAYWLYFGYRGFIMDHQNPKEPIYLMPNDGYYVLELQFYENTNYLFKLEHN